MPNFVIISTDTFAIINQFCHLKCQAQLNALMLACLGAA